MQLSSKTPSFDDKNGIFDELDISNNPAVKKLLLPGERLIFSGLLPKINKHEIYQDRFLIITSKNIYNIHPHEDLFRKLAFKLVPRSALKRKIPIDKIWGISISSESLSNQIVIHVSNDYDYRYDAVDKKEIILKSLCKAHFDLSNKSLPLYINVEKDLKAFQTTDDDFKAKIDKKPKTSKINLTLEILERGLEWIITNKNQIIEDKLEIFEINSNQYARNPGMSEEINPRSHNVEKPLPDIFEELDDFMQPQYQYC